MPSLFSNSDQLLQKIQHSEHSVVFSSLQEFFQPIEGKGFSVKYVWQGTEYYTLNGSQYAVNAGQYLLSNDQLQGHVEIDAGPNVKGICVNLQPQLIHEAVASFRDPHSPSPDPGLASFFCSDSFLENLYDQSGSPLGRALAQLANQAEASYLAAQDLSPEFFYSLAGLIVADQAPLYRQLNDLPAQKTPVKKELLRKLKRAHDYMNHHFLESLPVAQIASQACLSEFHFYRLFKSVYHISPHQYLLHLRLNHGKWLLENGENQISEVALNSGFTDIFSFSKAFRKQFGYPPSRLLQNSRI